MAGDTPDLEHRMAHLESQLAFQEDAISALDGVMAAQQQEILVLRRQLELLQLRLAEQSAGSGEGGDGPAMEKPPHY